MEKNLITPKYKKEIKDLIVKTDQVFDRIGRDFPDSRKNMVIAGLSYRSFQIASSIILLCDNHYESEASVLLRSLVENTIKLRWILNKETEERIGKYFQDPDAFEWGKENTGANLKDKMIELGFQDEYYKKVVKVCHSYSHANAESINWFPILKIEGKSGITDGMIYSIVYQMLGHIVKTYHDHISIEFNFYKNVFKTLENNQTKE